MVQFGQTRSLRDFQNELASIRQRLRETGQPMLVTEEGKPAIVVQDAEAYRALFQALEQAETVEAIRRGLADAEEGRVIPAEQFFRELRACVGLPPTNP